MARVQLEKLSKVYPGGVKAVDGIDLLIADREFVVLVGPSGCGKTTTLRLIAGLEEISGGQIHIGERVVNDVPPKDRDIAMVFQNYALYPHMTVYRNMAFGLMLRMMPNIIWRLFHRAEARKIRQEIDRRVRQVARVLDIEHLLDRKPRQLSGGQRQRVAVGRAIVREPAAFLFDEPLSNLDARLRVTTRAELKRLHQRLLTTTIYVTHDQEEAMTLGDRIVVMKDGRILQADTPLRVYNQPVNRFVAGFIGMPPMNFLEGRIRQNGGALVFEETPPSGSARPADASSDNPPGQLTSAGSGLTLSVSQSLHGKMKGWDGKSVVLGIRPEHLHLRPVEGGASADPKAGPITEMTVKINVIEPLGNDMDVYAETALCHPLVARVEAGAQSDSQMSDNGGSGGPGLAVGSRVRLYADLRKVHFFEPGDTGMNLSLSNEPAHALA